MHVRRIVTLTSFAAAAAFAAICRESPGDVAEPLDTPEEGQAVVVPLAQVSDADRALVMAVVAAEPLVVALAGDEPLTEATRPLQSGMFIFPTAIRDRDPIGPSVWVQVRLARPLEPAIRVAWRQLITTWRTGDASCTSYNQIWTQDFTAAITGDTAERDIIVEVHLASASVISVQPANATIARRDMIGDPHYLHRAA
jgi:hypothetical protein